MKKETSACPHGVYIVMGETETRQENTWINNIGSGE
jgi:hypothetical protein